jgi:hypothetical protein
MAKRQEGRDQVDDARERGKLNREWKGLSWWEKSLWSARISLGWLSPTVALDNMHYLPRLARASGLRRVMAWVRFLFSRFVSNLCLR